MNGSHPDESHLLDTPENGMIEPVLEAARHGSFDRLARLAGQLLEVPAAILTLSHGSRIRIIGAYGIREPFASLREWPESAVPWNQLLRTAEPCSVNQVAADFEKGPSLVHQQVKAYANIPLQIQPGELTGGFWIFNLEPRIWKPGELGLLSELASHAITECRYHQEKHYRSLLMDQVKTKHRLEMIGLLAAGTAHEMGNLLAGMMANMELAQNPKLAHTLGLNPLEVATKACQRARELVQHTLGLARPAQETRQNINLRSILEESESLLKMSLPSEVELVVSCDELAPKVNVEYVQVEQCILNLVINAWHALPQERGRITIKLDSLTLQSASAVSLGISMGRYARIQVIDTGSGMDSKTLQNLFRPFYTTKPAGSGSGLGLSIVREIMTAHQGTILVESTLHHGSTFTLLFPEAMAQMPIAEDRHPFPKPTSRKPSRILILDDDTWLVELAVRSLSKMGHHVEGFTHSQSAWKALESHPDQYDLVVTDASMPGESGVEFARRVQSLRSDLPVLLTSGCPTAALVEEAGMIGIKHVISKPATVREFSDAIHHALGEFRK